MFYYQVMASTKMAWSALILCFFLGACCVSARQIRVNAAADANQTTAEFFVDASKSQPMPETLFGIFFEVISFYYYIYCL